MRKNIFLLGLVLIVTTSAGAQANPANSLLLTSPSLAAADEATSSTLPPAIGRVKLVPDANSSFTNLPSFVDAPSLNVPSPDPQIVQGVFVQYDWQAYVGYTYFVFFETPGTTKFMNGFNDSIVYYFKDWFGLDGEFAAAHGTQSGFGSWFLFGGGGPRFRWSAPRGIELWGHTLVGYSHFTPQTALGPQGGFAFEVGGGADFNFLHNRWALRVGGDMIGSNLFHTYQYNPKFSTGIVYKF